MPQPAGQPHPVVGDAGRYQIVGFHYQRGEGGQEAFIDLHLRSPSGVRHLRFLSPQDVCVDRGFLEMSGGLLILDISSRGWERLAVLVDDFQESRGGVRFYARCVIDLDADAPGTSRGP